MPKFNIISQFLKDISFESPNVPELFFKQENGNAKLEVNIDVQIKGAENNLFMVDLITKVHSKLDADGKSIFLIESTYSGLVQMEEEKDEEIKKRILLVNIPALLFPTVRGLITRLTSESGFPTFTMQQIDFAERYEQENNKQ
ncbi:MAG: protein-export chaperone SecB [Rickettsiales bacterium]|jgi:preprotein translocase subunit SecB|nr:protein-export chaperone SecB [Rickettsiales bacterium]